MEAIWNYFFWQTLSINMLDDTSHILRASLTLNECSPFRNDKPRSEADQRALRAAATPSSAPTSPASTAPTRSTTARNPDAARVRAQSGLPPAQPGEQRGEGQPEAGPLPGQPDMSRPQVTLPPALEDLLDDLTPEQQHDLPTDPDALKRELEELSQQVGQPPPPPQATDQLLDFLLAP